MEGKDWLPTLCMTVILMFGIWGFTSYYAPASPDVNVDMSEVVNALNQLSTLELSEEQISLITQKIVAEFPEMKDLNNEQVKDMWDRLYEEEIGALEGSALLAVEDELELWGDEDYDDLIEFLEESLGIEIDEDEFKVYDIDEDDTEIEIINLGSFEFLDETWEFDDSEVNVHIEFKVRYEDIATDIDNKERVSVDAVVTYDDGEPEVELVYSL